MSNINNIVSVPQTVPDIRDVMYVPRSPSSLPTDCDLTLAGTVITNQGELGSCTAFALCAAMCHTLSLYGVSFDPSELFLYYTERDIEGRIGQEGASLRDTMRAALHIGVPPESYWTYDPRNVDVKPWQPAYDAAPNCRITGYRRVPLVTDGTIAGAQASINAIKSALSDGYPVIIAFQAQEWLRHLKGTLSHHPMLDTTVAGYANVIGGHATVVLGYADLENLGVLRPMQNSWAEQWGDHGLGAVGYALAFGLMDAFIIDGVAYNGAVYPTVHALPPLSTPNYDTLNITRLYVALFNNAPDAAGMTYWRNRLAAGETLIDIADAMFTSNAARPTYPGWMLSSDIARAFYISVLGRLPDIDGWGYWTNQLDSQGAGAVIVQLINAVVTNTDRSTLAAYSRNLFNGKVQAALPGVTV